jgi:hypothetical protein
MSAEIITLPSGRRVLDTGRVQIGIRHGERADSERRSTRYGEAMPRDIGADAEKVQSLLLSPDFCARRGSMADRDDAKTLHVRGMHDQAMRVLRERFATPKPVPGAVPATCPTRRRWFDRLRDFFFTTRSPNK